jgi:hypothetical protein
MITAATIAVIGVVAAVAGSGVGAYSAVAQGQAQDKASKFNAAVARNNAMAAQETSAYEAAQIRRKGLIMQGTQRANLAKSGVSMDSASGQDVIYNSQIQNEMDAMAALYTGKVSSNASESRARLAGMEGSNAVTGSYWNAGSSILSGVGRGGASYGDYLKTQSPNFP